MRPDTKEQSALLLKSISASLRRLDAIYASGKAIKTVFSYEAYGHRLRLKEALQKLMILDPASHARRSEDLLWRKVFYEPLHMYKLYVRNNDKPERVAEFEVSLKTHLLSGIGYYQSFLLQLDVGTPPEDVYCWLPTAFHIPFYTSHIDEFERTTNQSRDYDRRKIQRCLVYLGDLFRYLSEFGESLGKPLAYSYYTAALNFDPNLGLPHNQLGILDIGRCYGLNALFHYLLCLNAENPFEGARRNLLTVLSKNESRYRKLFGGQPVFGIYARHPARYRLMDHLFSGRFTHERHHLPPANNRGKNLYIFKQVEKQTASKEVATDDVTWIGNETSDNAHANSENNQHPTTSAPRVTNLSIYINDAYISFTPVLTPKDFRKTITKFILVIQNFLKPTDIDQPHVIEPTLSNVFQDTLSELHLMLGLSSESTLESGSLGSSASGKPDNPMFSERLTGPIFVRILMIALLTANLRLVQHTKTEPKEATAVNMGSSPSSTDVSGDAIESERPQALRNIDMTAPFGPLSFLLQLGEIFLCHVCKQLTDHLSLYHRFHPKPPTPQPASDQSSVPPVDSTIVASTHDSPRSSPVRSELSKTQGTKSMSTSSTEQTSDEEYYVNSEDEDKHPLDASSDGGSSAELWSSNRSSPLHSQDDMCSSDSSNEDTEPYLGHRLRRARLTRPGSSKRKIPSDHTEQQGDDGDHQKEESEQDKDTPTAQAKRMPRKTEPREAGDRRQPSPSEELESVDPTTLQDLSCSSLNEFRLRTISRLYLLASVKVLSDWIQTDHFSPIRLFLASSSREASTKEQIVNKYILQRWCNQFSVLLNHIQPVLGALEPQTESTDNATPQNLAGLLSSVGKRTLELEQTPTVDRQPETECHHNSSVYQSIPLPEDWLLRGLPSLGALHGRMNFKASALQLPFSRLDEAALRILHISSVGKHLAGHETEFDLQFSFDPARVEQPFQSFVSETRHPYLKREPHWSRGRRGGRFSRRGYARKSDRSSRRTNWGRGRGRRKYGSRMTNSPGSYTRSHDPESDKCLQDDSEAEHVAASHLAEQSSNSSLHADQLDEDDQSTFGEKSVDKTDPDSRKSQLMRDMARLRLLNQVDQLARQCRNPSPQQAVPNTPSTRHLASPYLVLDAYCWTSHLAGVKRLLTSGAFVLIVPVCVVAHLDFLKKSMATARVAIRYLEQETHAGNRYLRLQRPEEQPANPLQSMQIMSTRRESPSNEKDEADHSSSEQGRNANPRVVKRWLGILDCATYYNNQSSVPDANSPEESTAQDTSSRVLLNQPSSCCDLLALGDITPPAADTTALVTILVGSRDVSPEDTVVPREYVNLVQERGLRIELFRDFLKRWRKTESSGPALPSKSD